MKTLTQLHEDFKISYKTITKECFVYKLNNRGAIKIFNGNWSEINDFVNNVYFSNGEQVPVSKTTGWTSKEYDAGTYIIYIKHIDSIHDCYGVFFSCKHLISVPKINTHNITSMSFMFKGCENLENVPLFDTNALEYMTSMFSDCPNLNSETKRVWSQIYDFNKHIKK